MKVPRQIKITITTIATMATIYNDSDDNIDPPVPHIDKHRIHFSYTRLQRE